MEDILLKSRATVIGRVLISLHLDNIYVRTYEFLLACGSFHLFMSIVFTHEKKIEKEEEKNFLYLCLSRIGSTTCITTNIRQRDIYSSSTYLYSVLLLFLF